MDGDQLISEPVYSRTVGPGGDPEDTGVQNCVTVTSRLSRTLSTCQGEDPPQLTGPGREPGIDTVPIVSWVIRTDGPELNIGGVLVRSPETKLDTVRHGEGMLGVDLSSKQSPSRLRTTPRGSRDGTDGQTT